MGLELSRPEMGVRGNAPTPVRRRGYSYSGESGMSLVEVVLASLILLLIAVGILPLFTRAMASNVAGSDSTYVSNMATERTEEFLQLNFDAEPLRLDDGATSRVYNEVHIRDYPSAGSSDYEEVWIDGTLADVPAEDRAQWTRVTTIRQYSITDLATPLPGTPGTDPNGAVHVKEIEVAVAGLREGGPIGASKEITVRTLKSP